MIRIICGFFIACFCVMTLHAQQNVIDEVLWIVGDDAILRSDVENVRMQMQYDGERIQGDPECVIPERIAVKKLYLHQAKLDSIVPNEVQIAQSVDMWINYVMNQIGSREKMEEYFGKSLPTIRDERREVVRDQQIVSEMQRSIVGDLKITPSEVRAFYDKWPQDSLPFVPTSVEVQILSVEPKIPFEETDAIKARLREFTDKINKGEMEFSTLARLYSEDPESAKRGGELGFLGKGNLLPEFANVAFNLNDPKKVSKIVETEYGFHIIQLIEKRGDRVNCRHILLRPKVSEKETEIAMSKLDSLRSDIIDGKFSFEEATAVISTDKETRNNKGIMVNNNPESSYYGTSRFAMHELPQEIARQVDALQPGEFSPVFHMVNEKQKEIIAIIKLKSRIEGHKANLTDDFQAIKAIVEERKKDEVLLDWIKQKQQSTYIRVNKENADCDFVYPGWIKKN
ncbi:MAG: peptidylprolyl isomerase [Bacteroidales bacterium]|nr:peptidylprolyl isomerase [Bacteroidales bacterium]